MQKDTLIQLRASELFKITRRRTYTSSAGYRSDPVFNLRFVYNGSHDEALRGGGIYAIHYRGELLYAGIFTGSVIAKTSTPFVGNVAAERFWKHLDALTMRGGAVGFTDANYDKACALPDHPLVEAIRRSVAQRGRNSVKSYPCKVQFACEHWEDFLRIEQDPAILDGFTFTYGRLSPDRYRPDIPYQDLKAYLGEIEARILDEMKPRCNLKFHKPDDSGLALGPDLALWDGLRQAIKAPPLTLESDVR